MIQSRVCETYFCFNKTVDYFLTISQFILILQKQVLVVLKNMTGIAKVFKFLYLT